jgi:curved DNA-binding protein CbpA
MSSLKNPRVYSGSIKCYEVLGVSQSASDSEIKAANRKLVLQYRKLIRQFHPDNPRMWDDLHKTVRQRIEQNVQMIDLAYATLKDHTSRSQYDAILARPRRPRPTQAEPSICGKDPNSPALLDCLGIACVIAWVVRCFSSLGRYFGK